MYQIAGLDSKAIEEKVYEVLDSKIVVQKKNLRLTLGFVHQKMIQ